MIDKEEVYDIVRESLIQKIEQLALDNREDVKNIRLRIFMETTSSDPLIILFNRKFKIGNLNLKELVSSEGIDILAGLKARQVKSIIKAFFEQSMHSLNEEDSKKLSLSLFLINGEPCIGLYHNNKLIENLTLREVLDI